ncbi:MAG TPA: hypothetical protein VI248_26765, partial [Kineosporiaceae bacterium]
ERAALERGNAWIAERYAHRVAQALAGARAIRWALVEVQRAMGENPAPGEAEEGAGPALV